MWRVVALVWLCQTAGCGRLGFDSAANILDPDAQMSDAQPSSDAAPVPAVPALYIDFEGGEPLRDKTGNHTTQCTGSCPQIATGGPRGGYGTFAGAPGCIHVTDDLDLRSSIFTYAVWFRPSSTANQTVLSRPYESETGIRNTFELALNPDPDPAKVSVTTFVHLDKHVRSLTLGTWHHAAASYDGQYMRVYYDGVLVYAALAATLPLPLTPNEPLIGCDRDRGVDYAFFRGDVDDVRVYSVALGDAEIAALAAP